MPELLDILGQDPALAQLQRTLAGTRRPHAFIFAGPEGVGRRTTAVELAKLLLCESPPRRPNNGRLAGLPGDFPLQQGCGRCRSCRTVPAGTNPDFQVVYKELARYHDDEKVRDSKMQDLGIGVIRQFLIDPAGRASAGQRGKVFLVREAELMSIPAQNALLKTLEEPPAGVTIILTAGDPGDLLPTTRSRCQVVRFGPLPTELVSRMLRAGELPEEEARFWAEFTGGSIGLAGRLAEEGLYPFKRELVEALAELTDSSAEAIGETLTAAMEKRSRKLQGRDEDLAGSLAHRLAGQLLLMLLASVHRDALAVACGWSRRLAHADQAPALGRIADRLGPDALAEVLAQLAAYEQLLWRNVNAKLLWGNVAFTCVSPAGTELP